MKISNSWLKMAGIYRLFCSDFEHLDFSEKAKQEAYLFESKGSGYQCNSIFNQSAINGYLYGKKMLNITVSMWKDDIAKGLLFLSELYKDKFPHWWLNKIFNRQEAVVYEKDNY